MTSKFEIMELTSPPDGAWDGRIEVQLGRTVDRVTGIGNGSSTT